MTSRFSNGTGYEVIVQGRFWDVLKPGVTIPSTIEYVIPAGGETEFPTYVFFHEGSLFQERKHLTVHFIVNGIMRGETFEHDAFNENESIILEMGNDGSLKHRRSPMEKKDGALRLWFRGLLQILGKGVPSPDVMV